MAATEGVFTETAGGTTLAVTQKLIQSGRIGTDESIVVAITGNGLKTVEALDDEVSPLHLIQPQLSTFRELMTTL